VALHLHVAQWRVHQALFTAGIINMPGKKPATVDRPYKISLCNLCQYAHALACAFIKAPIEKAEAVLIDAGCEYQRESEKQIKVIRCPRYHPGVLSSWKKVISPSSGGGLAILRYPHKPGRF